METEKNMDNDRVFTKTTEVIKLPNGLDVVVKILTEPQVLHEGDGVNATSYIYLPVDRDVNKEGESGLDKRLQFGTRLCLCNSRLYENWGEYKSDLNMRGFKFGKYHGVTHHSVILEALLAAKYEINKLILALNQREEAQKYHCGK